MKKEKLPTAPASACRLRFFQPTRRPRVIKSDWMVTPWGKARVEGRLGQAHADLLDACMFTALEVDDDGERIHLLIDPYKVRKMIGGKSRAAGDWTAGLFRDLTGAVVEWDTTIHSKGGTVKVHGLGHVIDSVALAKAERGNPLGGKRELMHIALGEHWSKMVREDIKARYDPAVIAVLGHGVSQAVARLALTHNNGRNIKIDTALDQVGVEGKGYARRNARRNIREDGDRLRSVGVKITGLDSNNG